MLRHSESPRPSFHRRKRLNAPAAVCPPDHLCLFKQFQQLLITTGRQQRRKTGRRALEIAPGGELSTFPILSKPVDQAVGHSEASSFVLHNSPQKSPKVST